MIVACQVIDPGSISGGQSFFPLPKAQCVLEMFSKGLLTHKCMRDNVIIVLILDFAVIPASSDLLHSSYSMNTFDSNVTTTSI